MQTITPSPGSRAQSLSRYVQPWGPRTARSTTTAFSRIATIASSGTGEASTRYCQPMPSRRLPSTCRNPVSESITASRTADWPPGAAPVRRSSLNVVISKRQTTRRRVCLRAAQTVQVTTWLQTGNRIRRERGHNRAPADSVHVRGVRELPELPRDHERDLLADVDRVVADRARARARRASSTSPTRAGPRRSRSPRRARTRTRLSRLISSSWRTRSSATATSRSRNACLALLDLASAPAGPSGR